MKDFAKSIVRFAAAEDGPTAVEYAVMLALIVMVCVGAIVTVGTSTNTVYTNMGNSLTAATGGGS